MKKTLAEILSDCREQMQQSIDTIDKLIAETQNQGIEWPELDEIEVPKSTKILSETRAIIDGEAFIAFRVSENLCIINNGRDNVIRCCFWDKKCTYSAGMAPCNGRSVIFKRLEDDANR